MLGGISIPEGGRLSRDGQEICAEGFFKYLPPVGIKGCVTCKFG